MVEEKGGYAYRAGWYEILLNGKVRLKQRDGEVEEFYCWSIEEVKISLQRGGFKGNSGAVMGREEYCRMAAMRMLQKE
jgi:hypothetical protein